MVHGKNRIPYRTDRRLTGLAGPDYDAPISFGLPIELGDCPYGKSPLKPRVPGEYKQVCSTRYAGGGPSFRQRVTT